MQVLDPPRLLREPEYRVEGPLKVTGSARYTADVTLPGMLWCAYTRSDRPHARILSVDVSAARELPGVHKVLTGADTGDVCLGRRLLDWPALARDRVRIIGDRIAAVAAESREIAEEAASLVGSNTRTCRWSRWKMRSTPTHRSSTRTSTRTRS